MRILQIRFKNLNSLVGEWLIDLAHPAFTAEGIFAITGATGAGKSTILDALCLALYGRTPRLSKVTKGGNEIMSRQTGECFAEVTFETSAGQFRCHWSQHRARKNAHGDLQAPKHEIADAVSGALFETKLRGVAEQIEATTGMDFERFTRSMLLAQGGFAAFLQAAADDRAPILEQITGTEIYSHISIKIHERRTDERKKYEVLHAELAGMPLLSDAEQQQLHAERVQKTQAECDLTQQHLQIQQALAWLTGIERLEQELTLLAEQQQDVSHRQAAFKPEHDRLERAKQALELTGIYASLCALRREQAADSQSHTAVQQALPEQEADVKCVEEALKQAIAALAQQDAQQQQLLLLCRQVRALDLQLSEKVPSITAAESGIVATKKSLDAVRTLNDTDCRVLAQQQATLENIVRQLAETQADEQLVEQFTGMCSRFDTLRELERQQQAKRLLLANATTEQCGTAQICAELTSRLAVQKNALATLNAAFTQQQLELKTCLNGLDMADWRAALTDAKERKVRLEAVTQVMQSLAESRRGVLECTTRQDSLVIESTVLAEQLVTQTGVQSALEREVLLLETQLSLLNKIHSFEAARQHLQDGEACPLCGAAEHPFAVGNIPTPDAATTALKVARATLKQASTVLSKLAIKQAETLKDLEQAAAQRHDYSNKVTHAVAQLHTGLSLLAVEIAEQDLSERLPRLVQENEQTLTATVTTVQILEALEKSIEELRASVEKVSAELMQWESDTQRALHNHATAEQAVLRIEKEWALIVEQVQKAQAAVLVEVAIYGINNVSLDTLDGIQGELSTRREQWLSRQQQRIELDKQVATLQLQTVHQNQQIEHFDIDLHQQQERLRLLLDEQAVLRQERLAFFGEKEPDDEEHHYSTLLEKANRHLDVLRQQFNDVSQNHARLKNKQEDIAKAMLARAEPLAVLDAEFANRLSELNFADEAAYQAASLSEEVRKELLQKTEQLTREQTEMDTRRRDKANLLDTERQKQVTEQLPEQLLLMRDDLQNDLRALQQALGAILQKLTDHERQWQAQQDRMHVIDAQKRECERWDCLHALIGSADGKKYRNFAQGLTFEMMVGHANRQLQKMTDRYLLLRDDKQPLELNVVDNYQAGEIRSTKNLSGGESFIVSLALALGLSHMASRNVRVDSLFLDEGFGTLDEEALDTALETLSGLQQEGKLIGVISHVSTLKDRITTQIHVTPQTGGRSVISGPGCCRLV
ncbi:MAG: AAA family ATPase [Methylococcales bacterium]|nr:AAA family ATPase [Methylococcales bacterium]